MVGLPTGVIINKEVVNMYNNDFKMTGAKSPKYDYITCMIDDGEVVKSQCPLFGECENEEGLKKESTDPLTFQSMKKHLLEMKAGYGLYIFQWQRKDGVKSSKVVQISYCDDGSASTKQKMLYSGTKSTIQKALKTEAQIQINDPDEFNYKEIINELSKAKAVC